MKILAQRVVRLNDLITHKLMLSQWQQAFDFCEQKRAIKVLISPEEA
jgi:threonine dehydrogenase-like Zn-dependent dehydrogenase